MLNVAKVFAWARDKGVPLIRWRLPLRSDKAASLLDKESQDALYEEEPALWGYFAKGARGVMIKDNLSQGRGMVNGTRVLLHSLTLTPRAEVAVRNAQAGSVITLPEVPISINVQPLVSTAFLERLRPFSILGDDEPVVVPISKRSQPLAKEISSVFAASELPKVTTLNVETHAVELGYAFTDFKMQGKTVDKFVLSLAPRDFEPPFSLSSV